jgi:ferredoxin-NADP reductase
MTQTLWEQKLKTQDVTPPAVAADVERDAVVVARAMLTPDIVELALQATPGSPSFGSEAWQPGSHVDVQIPGGAWRQYSLVGNVDDAVWKICVLHEPNGRGGSVYLHGINVGDHIVVRGPRNNFPLRPARRHRFLAGGIGVTPLISLAKQAIASGSDVTFTYCGRSRAAMAFLPELRALLGDRLIVHPDDETGLPNIAALLAEVEPETLIYACGPGGMLDAAVNATGHWPAGALQIERFVPVNTAHGPDIEFEVEVASTGKSYTVPVSASILEVLLDNGIQVLSSCAEGTCGTCETVVLDGIVDHRDSVLSPEEHELSETMMICVSRARGPRLKLEL